MQKSLKYASPEIEVPIVYVRICKALSCMILLCLRQVQHKEDIVHHLLTKF